MQDPALFALAVLAILAMPGPTNALLATAGAVAGWLRSLPLVPAAAAGYLASVLTLGLVLGPAVASSPALAAGLRAVVGAYLVLLAVRLWRSGRGGLAAGLAVSPAQVFLTTLLNPKGIVLALGVMPFGAPRLWPYLLAFVVLLSGIAAGWIAAGSLLGRAAAGQQRESVVPRVGAAVVGTFGVMVVILPFLR